MSEPNLDDQWDIEGEMIERGFVECGWCNYWKKEDEECPRCWRKWHSDESAP